MRITVKGMAEDDEPTNHMSYRLYGSWVSYTNQRTKKVEKQFHFRTFVRSSPHSRAGVVKYLEKAPNIGRVLAGRLFDRFKGDAVRILREEPDVAAVACPKLSVDGAREAAAWLETERALEDCTIELIDLLDGRGFRKSLARDVVKDFGNRAAQVIKKNSYILMKYRGCGFKLADSLYLDLGGRAAALKRQAMCAAYAVGQATSSSGDTWHYVGVAEQGLKGSVGGADVRLGDALRLASRGQILARVWTDCRDGLPTWDGNIEWVADIRKAQNEARVAEYVAEAMRENGERFTVALPNVSEHQLSNLAKALSSGNVGSLGGSPGTGKTYAAAAWISFLIDRFGVDSIAVCAPTGKAAVRISEAMAAYGIPLRAKTIHSLLLVSQADERGGWSFEHNRANPLPFRFIIVDESSMIDVDLMAALLAARARGTHILFVGDVNQLPPVGHGAPLRDFIAAGLPYGELTKIRRNSGGIVQACADIRDGKPFTCEGNLHHVAARQSGQQIESLLKIISDVATAEKLNRVWDIQVVTAVNKKSPLCRKELNKVLQNAINPNPIVEGSPFRLADKVVNTKNGFYPPADADKLPGEDATTNERGDIYVANGELGEVVRVEPKYLEVKLTSPERFIRVPRGGGQADEEASDDDATGTGCNWDLAYGLSVHKSQGSEWPVVIVMLDDYPGAKKICDRAWIYTAISRAKQACYLVGQKATADKFCRQNNIAKRKTFLKEAIYEQLSQSIG